MKYYIACFVIIVSAYAAAVHANGFGVTLDQVVGDYTANVDYDAIGGIFTGTPVQFAFQLFNKDRSQPIDFSDVWVSITPKGAANSGFMLPIFDGGIVGSGFPPSGMTFTFLAGGSYELRLRYDKGVKTLAEATFPLTVGTGGGKNLTTNGASTGGLMKGIIIGVFSMLFIGLAVWFLRRKKV